MPRFGFLTQWFRTASPPTADGELLARYAVQKDEAAFTELVRRHGSLVWGVCRRIVGHEQDAEEAFQATFLILARRAGEIRKPELLGNWLYGVAIRVAGKARRRMERRVARESAAMPDVPAPSQNFDGKDLARVVDEELATMPKHYREAIVLCDVQSLSRSEAAIRLGIPEGTLSSRLNLGRKKLADRLTKRGISASIAGVTAAFAVDANAFGLSEQLITKTVTLAATWATTGQIPIPILEISSTGISTMRIILALSIAVILTTATGITIAAWPATPAEAVQAPPRKPATPPEPAKDNTEAETNKEFRAKRMKIIDLPHTADQMHWLPDGKNIVLTTNKKATIVRLPDYLISEFNFDKPKKVASVCQNLNANLKDALKTHPYAIPLIHQESGRINSEQFIDFWSPTISYEYTGDPKVAELTNKHFIPDSEIFKNKVNKFRVNIEYDIGGIIAILPSGKQILTEEQINSKDVALQQEIPNRKNMPKGLSTQLQDTEINRRKGKEYIYKLRDIENLIKPVSMHAINGILPVTAVSPDGNTLVVSYQRYDQDRHLVDVDVFDLKRGVLNWKWSGEFDKIYTGSGINPSQNNPIVFSPDGKSFSVITLNSIHQTKPISQKGRLLVFRTGSREGPLLLSESLGIPYELGNFSADSRFFVGICFDNSDGKAIGYLVVWDTMTGKIVKSWQGRAIARFSPIGSQLAIYEVYVQTTVIENMKNAIENHFYSLGFYDCSGIGK